MQLLNSFFMAYNKVSEHEKQYIIAIISIYTRDLNCGWNIFHRSINCG